MESLGDNSEAYQSGLRQQIPFATGGLEPRLKVFSRGSQVAIREVSGRERFINQAPYSREGQNNPRIC